MHLVLLTEIADTLERSLQPKEALQLTLQIMARHLAMKRAAISLTEPDGSEVRIYASVGFSATEQARGHYAMGEGITGRVIASGRPEIVPDVADDARFLNRTRARNLRKEHTAFICVPIRLDDQVVGALAVDRRVGAKETLDDQSRLLTVIAGLLSHTAGQCRADLSSPPKKKSAISDGRIQGVIGQSESMNLVFTRIRQAAPSSATILLRGESGTGKELAAHAIHEASGRNKHPFISLNCAALPDSLVESELFGHERGAFTGATGVRKGRFELADTGTLFLDEVGELSLAMQAKLLRVIQERSFERLGGMESIQVDVRLIAATNRDLEQMVKDGSFRKDLYYRLNVFPIQLPPLRERQEDILSLAAYFVKKYSEANGKTGVRLSLSAMEMLQRYRWPGNIRELENVIERAVLLVSEEGLILPLHLPPNLHSAGCPYSEKDGSDEPPSMGSLQQRLDEMEKAYIIEALSHFHGHLGHAARALGLTERMMALRMKKYGITYKAFRASSS